MVINLIEIFDMNIYLDKGNFYIGHLNGSRRDIRLETLNFGPPFDRSLLKRRRSSITLKLFDEQARRPRNLSGETRSLAKVVNKSVDLGRQMAWA